MLSNRETLIKAKDEEIVKLLADNRELSEELRQCQADKEFVWTLWKRLQVSSPDLTQAVSLVMQREKEKCETKDRKVLEILQSKDEQIENLQDTVTSLKRELDKLVQMKASLEGTRTTLTAENEDMKRRNDIINERLAKVQTLGNSEAIGLKKSMEDLKQERGELNDKVTKLLIDLQTSRMESQTLEIENEQLKKRTKKLEEENDDLLSKSQKLQRERESLSEEVLKLKKDLLHFKDGEDTARREQLTHRETRQSYEQLKAHSEEQQSVILKLQSLNEDAQRVLREQEKAYKEEISKSHRVYSELARKYEGVQKSHKQLEKVHDDLKKRLGSQDKAMWKTEKELKRSLDMATRTRRRNRSLDDFDGLETDVASQQEEIELLRRRLKEKNVQLAEMKQDNDKYSPAHTDYDAYVEHTFSPIVEKIGRGKERQMLRPRSLSPVGRNQAQLNRKLKATEEKLDSTKRLLDLKKQELKMLKKAHDKRLNRLKEVQVQFRELKETLYEKEMLPVKKPKTKKRVKRPNVAELRQEDCDAVWNELAFYKRENRNLIQEKLSLEEDLDNLRVQAAMDKATVQELNMCLKQEKDDLMSKLRQNLSGQRRSSTPKKSQVQDDADPPTSASTTASKHLVKNLERKLENAAEDNRLLKKECSQLNKEIRVLKDENKCLKQDVTDCRQTNAKLRRNVVEMRHQVENAEDKKLQAELDANDIIKEAEQARATSVEGREANNALRDENNDLRAELAALKTELREITNSLEEAENTSRASKHLAQRAPLLSARTSSTKLCSDSARKHQEFLDKSISGMKAAFDQNKYGYGNENSTQASSDDGESDMASLGERIVRAATSVPGLKQDSDDQSEDDNDTLVGSDVKPSKSARTKLPLRRGVGDLAALKQRLASMQKQCSSLKMERQNALRQVSEEKERNELLESEIKGVQNRLKSAKASIQKLHREVEVISREKEEVQRTMESVKNSMPEPQKHSDTDYRLLENKMRLANSDANHYLEQLKKSQKENEEKVETITGLKEKVARLERDVTMKRQLIEEQRTKIKSANQMNQNEQKIVSDLESELRQVQEEMVHKKNYIDSLKKQVQAVGRDKARYEQSYNEAKAQLEKRCEQVSVEQARKLEAENLASQLESTVEQQLNTLASKSEQALEKMQSKLTVSEEKNKEYSACIQILSSQLLDMLNQFRTSIQGHKDRARQDAMFARETDPSLSRAQSIACSILNMSKADFDDLMTPVDSRKREEQEQQKSSDTRADKDWKTKVEEISKETPPFAKSLNRLLWDKIQDAVHLAEEKCRIQYEPTLDRTS